MFIYIMHTMLLHVYTYTYIYTTCGIMTMATLDIYREHPIGKTHKAGVKDVIGESAMS